MASDAAGGFLRITLDAVSGELVGKAHGALLTTFPDRHIGVYKHPVHRKVDLQLSHRSLAYAFPQHGPGRKHEREIALVPWQLQLTQAYPERLLRGLIHSDGSRCINRFSTKLPSGRVATYEYPRYFFTNYSTDIRRFPPTTATCSGSAGHRAIHATSRSLTAAALH